MTFFMLALFFIVSIWMAASCLTEHGKRLYEPQLPMATVFIGFIGLQLLGFANRPWDLPPGALDKTIIMAVLCVSAFWWGYSRKTRPLALLSNRFALPRLLAVSLGLTLFGAVFFFLISRLPEEMTSMARWTGLAVAYLFFAQTLPYGFALACLVYSRVGDRRALWIGGFGALFYLDRIVLAGRRAAAAEFFFIIVLALFFGRSRLLPRALLRWVMVAVMVVMVLLMYSTGDYRTLAKTQAWEAPLQATTKIAFIDNLVSVIQHGGHEVRNAVFMIEAYDRTLHFDFGLSHWNELINNYIPAQLVGRDVKEFFMVPLPDVAARVFGYRAVYGSTVTGLVDSFGSFWYFGCIKFFIIGLVLRKIWNAAKVGDLAAQLLYMLLIVKAMHAVTHSTHWFVAPWVHIAVFLFPGLWWAQRQRKIVRKVIFHETSLAGNGK
jgi:hypothetical protein